MVSLYFAIENIMIPAQKKYSTGIGVYYFCRVIIKSNFCKNILHHWKRPGTQIS